MRRAFILAAAVVVLALIVGAVFAAAPKTYQVTGPALSVNDTTIVVQKGEDKWEIARDTGTKVTGDLKVGAKVTIQYRMIATSVEVKAK
jgi:cell division protein YceG involved in septum cleavage